MIRFLFYILFKLLFRVEIKGLDNFKNAGNKTLIICNHTSLLDPLLLAVFLKAKLTFAINTHVSKKLLFKPIISLAKVFPLDPTNPLSLKGIIQYLKEDNHTVIFPEGRLTTTGGIMKIYDGTGMVADKTGANIIPVIINGTEYTHFSRMKSIFRLRWFPKITIEVFPHRTIENNLTGKERRVKNGQILSDILRECAFLASGYQTTLCDAVLDAKKIHGGKTLIAEDIQRKPINYDTLLMQAIVIGKLIKAVSVKGEAIGLLLPNAIKTLSTILGLHWYERIPAMLNFSVGSAAMISACHTANISTVLTSRLFIENGKLTNEITQLEKHVKVIYLEDLAKQFLFFKKISAVLQVKLGFKPVKQKSSDTAVILFTSGSEGTPKGVVLSHQNVMANLKQVKSRYDFTPKDVVLNVLPMFHSFGFTVGTFLPLLHGIKTFFYPSPLHYSVIPELAYDTGATLLFGTNTFLAAYGKKAHTYDFFKMRYVIAGAEKLQDSTKSLWHSKFGIRIMEGYGATETSPITSVNTPYEYCEGSVGRMMPGMRAYLEAIPGIEKGGKMHVSGPNIMKGYYLSDNPGVLVPPKSDKGEGWYDTGDIIDIDVDGFLHIQGRSKRFAKISGEMVSLSAVEFMAGQTWPNAQHVIVSLPDARKGEQIMLLTTQKDATVKVFQAGHPGVASIQFPKVIHVIDKIPVLTTGKTDYLTATKVAESLSKPEIDEEEYEECAA